VLDALLGQKSDPNMNKQEMTNLPTSCDQVLREFCDIHQFMKYFQGNAMFGTCACRIVAISRHLNERAEQALSK
jgi:hypothetical protein